MHRNVDNYANVYIKWRDGVDEKQRLLWTESIWDDEDTLPLWNAAQKTIYLFH